MEDSEADSTAIVPSTNKKRAKLSFCKNHLLLPFGKSTFYVPEEAVLSIPKGTNLVANTTILNQIISTKSPTTWNNYLDPDRLILIKGSEGKSVYTTFKVMDQTSHEEEVFIRHIPPTVCDKQFPKWKELIEKDTKEGKRKPPENDRQEQRLNVLNWKSKDCSRAQINPEHNNWEVCKDPPKSLKHTATVAPGGKRTGPSRSRPAGANGSADDCSDVLVTSSDVGGDSIRTFRIPVGKDFLAPKLIDGYLYVTTVKPTTLTESSNDTAQNDGPVGQNDDAHEGDD